MDELNAFEPSYDLEALEQDQDEEAKM